MGGWRRKGEGGRLEEGGGVKEEGVGRKGGLLTH